MLLLISCGTIAYVRRQKAKAPFSNYNTITKTKLALCFSLPNLKSRLRRKPEKQFTISYRKANTIDSDDNVDIRPRIPPQPLSTYIPDQMAGYTLPNTSRPSHIIHPTSSLNRLRSEIANEVNPAIKYFTMDRVPQNHSENYPTAPCAGPVNEISPDHDFYNTPVEHLKTTNENND